MERDGRIQVAVVDDDAVFVELLALVFGEQGWDTLGFRGDETTFVELARCQPDLIILDLHLGTSSSGWNLLALIEGDPRTFHIPVIICSAATVELRGRQQWLEQRGIATLDKPFDIDDLLTRAGAALVGNGQVRQRHQSA